jgi:hypothetical protein
VLGVSRLPAKWVQPMSNEVRSFVIGYDHSSMTGLADVAYDLSRKIRRRGG